jgi:hypothetical protein
MRVDDFMGGSTYRCLRIFRQFVALNDSRSFLESLVFSDRLIKLLNGRAHLWMEGHCEGLTILKGPFHRTLGGLPDDGLEPVRGAT